MTQETITLQEVLNWIDTKAPFAIAVITDDENRNTGGEWLEYKEARKHCPLTKDEEKRLAKAQPEDLSVRKDPHHYENSTRNIILPNGEIRKIAIRLIRRFGLPGLTNLHENGKIVL